MPINNPQEHFHNRLTSLKMQRQPYLEYWRDISRMVNGFQSRHMASSKNTLRKIERNRNLLNGRSRLASRTQRSGMQAGITNPSQEWFKLTTGDKELTAFGPVKLWLHEIEKLMNSVMSSSNIYDSFHMGYGDIGNYAVSAMGIFGDFEDVIFTRSYPVGSFCIGVDGFGNVDTFYYEDQASVGELAKRYGKHNLSETSRKLLDKNMDALVPFVHAVEPNTDRDLSRFDNKNMKFRSVFFEPDSKNKEKLLSSKGFVNFPILTPRWEKEGTDVYGFNSPGMIALHDITGLQLDERRRAQAIDKAVDPPLQAPSSMRGKLAAGGLRNGEIIFRDETDPKTKVESVYDVNLPLRDLREDMLEKTSRINEAYYVDLFQLMISSDRRMITAREIEAREGEKLVMLGPVLTRLHHEQMDRVIGLVFDRMQRVGMLPPPPRDLLNETLKVDYVSILAQAQKRIATDTISDTVGFVGSIVDIWPEARNKIDPYRVVDEYADAVGSPPTIVLPTDQADQMTQQQRQQAQMEQALAAGQQGADIAKTLSGANIDDSNLLQQVADGVG